MQLVAWLCFLLFSLALAQVGGKQVHFSFSRKKKSYLIIWQFTWNINFSRLLCSVLTPSTAHHYSSRNVKYHRRLSFEKFIKWDIKKWFKTYRLIRKVIKNICQSCCSLREVPCHQKCIDQNESLGSDVSSYMHSFEVLSVSLSFCCLRNLFIFIQHRQWSLPTIFLILVI